MSKINCDACAELREYAPDFVLNGVTDTIATSLKNDTGFNPGLTALHTDCEDLNDANDCLIGRLDGEIEAYDVCDWKEFMHKFLPNLYELLKAIIAAVCGLWKNVHSLRARADLLCSSIDNIFGLIRGGGVKSHPGVWFDSFYDKLQITFGSASGQVVQDPHVYMPSVDADVLSGAGCDTAKRLGRWMLNVAWETTPYPYGVTTTVTDDLSVGEPLGIVYRANVPASDISDARWRYICRNGGVWPWYILNKDTLWYVRARGYTHIDGVAINADLAEYGEDNLVIFVDSFIGPSRKGSCTAFLSGDTRSYDA